MLTTVTGVFREFEGAVETENDDFSTAKIRFSAKTASVSTGSDQRDGHLRSPDFFDSEKFPELGFESSSVNKKSENEFTVTGNLAMHGITKPVVLDVELTGRGKDPWGNEKAGFTISGKLNRKDWGLLWNAPLEAGGLLVSEEIKLHCEVQVARA